MMTTYYKCLSTGAKSCNGGNAEWFTPHGKRPGRWMPKVEVNPCLSGYHLCEAGDLPNWLNAEIWIAEGRGENVRSENKTVFAQARLISRVENWNQQTARLFACDCAARALKRLPADQQDPRSWNAILVSQRFAFGAASKDEMAAAGDAARDAARAAARDAAWDAARAAAWDAAWDAAGDAAGDAERKWQTKRLFQYLDGKVDLEKLEKEVKEQELK